LEKRFTGNAWREINEILYRLEVPRTIRLALREVILSHTALKNEPIMVNTLIDYLDLWSNLHRQLHETLSGYEPASGVSAALSHNLIRFIGKMSHAISGRYYSSSFMFEVPSLNPNHRGGVDVFLNAYSELVHLVLRSCRYIDRKSHTGIVKVALGNPARIYSLFGSIVELDWAHLSSPESAMTIFHEMGHQILRDRALELIERIRLSGESWTEITTAEHYQQGHSHGESWASTRTVRQVFGDIFCDLFMLHLIAASFPEGESHTAMPERLLTFYDRWFWTEAEINLKHITPIGRNYLSRLIVRWYCVRTVVSHWERTREMVPNEERQQFVEYIEQIVSWRQNATREQERLLNLGDDSYLGAEKLRGKSRKAHGPRLGKSFRNEILVDMPGSFEQWCELLEQRAGAFSQMFAKRLHGQTGNDTPDKTDEFASDAYTVLYGYLRPGDRNYNAAQVFLLLSQTVLDIIVCPERNCEEARTDMAIVHDIFRLAEGIYAAMFDQGDDVQSYAQLIPPHEKDAGRIVIDPERPYAPVVINPMGAVLVLDERLRQQIFGKRLALINRLSDRRLARVSLDLAHLEDGD